MRSCLLKLMSCVKKLIVKNVSVRLSVICKRVLRKLKSVLVVIFKSSVVVLILCWSFFVVGWFMVYLRIVKNFVIFLSG